MRVLREIATLSSGAGCAFMFAGAILLSSLSLSKAQASEEYVTCPSCGCSATNAVCGNTSGCNTCTCTVTRGVGTCAN